MSIKNIYMCAKGEYFEYYGDALANIFKILGHNVIRYSKDQWEVEPPPIDVDFSVFVCPYTWADETVRAIKGPKIAILTEPLPNFWTTSADACRNLKVLTSRYVDLYDFFIEWSLPSYNYLIENLPSLFSDKLAWFPHGYIVAKPNIQQSIRPIYDVVFLGDVTRSERRRYILNELRTNGVSVYPTPEGTWGSQKEYALLDSKIVLNIHFSDHLNFETPRLFEAGSYNKFVISETLLYKNDIFWMNSVETCPLQDIVDKVILFQDDTMEIKRQQIANNLYKSIQKYPMSDLADLILMGAATHG